MIYYFSDLKDFIEAIIGLDRNVLHVHLGIALFILFAWIFSGPGRYRKAFFWLLVLELVNEFIDAMMALDRGRSPNWPDTLADIINTLIWPAIWCLWRHHRRLRAERAAGSTPGAAKELMAGAWVDPMAAPAPSASRSASQPANPPARSSIGTLPPDKGGPA